MSEIEEAPNIGIELGRRLRAVGISTRETLMQLGDEAAFRKLAANFPDDACTHTRLALAGAVRDMRWHGLDKALRAELTRGLK
jgi:DNA transformation protein and related proteins